MPYVDKTHPVFKWSGRDDGDTMAYMWQVVVVVVVVVMMMMMTMMMMMMTMKT
jgi:hypothetical protein